jgi:uncharacterized repeat protein (TIGR02543 family)
MKKLLAVLALFAIGLSACGGGGNSSSGKGGGGGNGGGGNTQEAPAFTSANAATFTQSTAGTFTVTASGTPAPSITESGALPAGVTFTTPTLSGTATASGTFPITFTASNGVSPNATQSFTLTVNAVVTPPPSGSPMQLTNLSEAEGNPFDQITISGANFEEGTEAISVVFTPENGDPIQIVPTASSSADQVSVMIPPFFNSAGTSSPETVDVRILAFDSTTTYVSNVIKGLSVAILPPAYGAQPGVVTAALLTATQNISLSVQNAVSANSAYSGFVAPLGQLNMDTASVISALNNSLGGSISVPTQGGGTITLTAPQIVQADQVAQALVASFVTQAGVPLQPLVSGCPNQTGDAEFDVNLCSTQQYFQNLAASATPNAKRRTSAAKAQVALTKFQAAAATFSLNLVLGVGAGLVGEGPVYEIVLAPVASTFISSLVVTGEIPSTTDVKVGVTLAAFDNLLFEGTPVCSTTWDELQVLGGFFSEGPPSPESDQVPSGEFFWDFGGYENNTASQLHSWTAAGQPINENIGLPELNTGVSGVDSTTLVLPPSPAYYSLTISAGVGGSVGVNAPGPYVAGTTVTVTATANQGYTFTSWTGACAGQGMSCTLTMDSDLSTAATFTPNTPPPPPPPPSSPSGVYTGNFSVSFTAPTNTVGQTVTCYFTAPGGVVQWTIFPPTIVTPLMVSADWTAYWSGSPDNWQYCGESNTYGDADVSVSATLDDAGNLTWTDQDGYTYNATINAQGQIFGSTTYHNQWYMYVMDFTYGLGYSPYLLDYTGPLGTPLQGERVPRH